MKYQTIIIGAGTAGIFAGRELREQGHHNFLVLEAADDIGGRVRTYLSKTGKPHELGGAFLHSEPENPFAQWLMDQGHRLVFLDPTENIVINGQPLRQDELLHFSRCYEDIRVKADVLAHKNPDATAADLLNGDPVHDAAVRAFAGSTETGAELHELSLLDVAGQIELHQNAMLKGSLQDALRDAAKELPIRKNTAVTAIDHAGDVIRLTTSASEFECKKLIVTASVDAITQIKFNPPLPEEKQHALQHLRMGRLNKLVMKHDDMLWPFGECFYALLLDDKLGQFEAWIFPHAPSTLAILYGGHQKPLTREDFTTHLLPQLAPLLPNLPDNPVQWQQETHWQDEAYIRGGYSALRPGMKDAREVYSQPIDGRIFFAGEAADNEWATQLPGAMLSGKLAAQTLLKG